MNDKDRLPWAPGTEQSDWERMGKAAQDVADEASAIERQQSRLAIAVVLLAIALLICVGAFASRASAAEPMTIPQLAAMPEREFVALVMECRSTTRYADTHTCRNAEHAFELRYAEIKRRDALAVMRSPLFWANNRASAFNVMRACAAGEAWARKWCGVVQGVYGKAT